MSYLVCKRVAPLGFAFDTYLAQPRPPLRAALRAAARGEWIFTRWDERHDALRFDTWWAAAWQAFRHFPARVVREDARAEGGRSE